jgi:hypothetical protein
MNLHYDQNTSRPNAVLAAIVEQGIALQETHGMHYAARFLNDRKVGIKIIERVLLRPQERRKGMPAQVAPADWSGQAA